MASGINCIYIIIFGKFIDLTFKIIAVFTVPVEQDQRFSLAFFYVIVLDVHLDWVCFSKVR